MATATKIAEFVFAWEGRDRNVNWVPGETRTAGRKPEQAPLRTSTRSATGRPFRRMESALARSVSRPRPRRDLGRICDRCRASR